ncbi:hypothetical protein G6L46_10140 [Agrobacterium rhizogenes]|uniref:hypothetical protein n=1 Tax=Rhizobium rhizogenes TaxID=359 RepID=UPI001574522C|nr:hypothetical protein [Rhizobium rhizogenes]NTF87483.1 hypothetical protein [Rhizobium rhizogenes]
MTQSFARIESGVVVEILRAVDGFSFEESFHPDIVASCVECDDEVAPGWAYDGADFSPEAEVPIDLEVLKASLKVAVDVAAEAERLKYITPGVGQSMTYQQKATEASRYLAATDPDAADYPLLNAEVGITAADIAGVATVVDAAFKQWQAIGSAIEAVRLGAKVQIASSADADEANAVYVAIAWPA